MNFRTCGGWVDGYDCLPAVSDLNHVFNKKDGSILIADLLHLKQDIQYFLLNMNMLCLLLALVVVVLYSVGILMTVAITLSLAILNIIMNKKEINELYKTID